MSGKTLKPNLIFEGKAWSLQASGITKQNRLGSKGLQGQTREYLRGKYHCTIDLLFDWFRISCMTTDKFCFYLQNRLIQTSQAGGQWYSDASPFSIPWTNTLYLLAWRVSDKERSFILLTPE